MKAKYRVIYKFSEVYPICRMCRFFKVSRSGYYDWLARLTGVDKDTPMLEMIAQCQKENDGTYGYRRCAIWLTKRCCRAVNHKAVARLMRKYGLNSVIRRSRKTSSFAKSNMLVPAYENFVNRNFTAERPNIKWVTDITCIRTKEGLLYLSAVMDLYDGFIVGYTLDTRQGVRMATESISCAHAVQMVKGSLMVHSDQGFQYRSWGYARMAENLDITPSMSRRGNCLDNSRMESFFGTLKVESIYLHKPKTLNEAKELVVAYIDYYNHRRISLKTKMTPYEKRCQVA